MSEHCSRNVPVCDSIREWNCGNEVEAALYDSMGESYRRVSGRQLREMIQNLRLAFDAVRLVRLSDHAMLEIDANGSISGSDMRCFAMQGREGVCERCIAGELQARRGRTTRLEVAGDALCHMTGLYLEIDGTPCSLEMITWLSVDALADGGQDSLMESISRCNARAYADPVTGVYNQRYYREQLRGVPGASAVAVLSLDDFERVSESYGSAVGDRALRAVAEAVLACVRRSDTLVRFGGDEFLLIFRNIPRDALRTRLRMIREKVEMIYFQDCPELRLRASVGGKYGSESTEMLAAEATRLMREARREGCGVRMD